MSNNPIYLSHQMHSLRYDRSKTLVNRAFLFLDANIAEAKDLIAALGGPRPQVFKCAVRMSIFKEWHEKTKNTHPMNRRVLNSFMDIVLYYCIFCGLLPTTNPNQRSSRLPSSHGGEIGDGIIDAIFPLMPLDKPGCFIELGCNSGRLSNIVKLTHPHLYVVQIEKDINRYRHARMIADSLQILNPGQRINRCVLLNEDFTNPDVGDYNFALTQENCVMFINNYGGEMRYDGVLNKLEELLTNRCRPESLIVSLDVMFNPHSYKNKWKEVKVSHLLQEGDFSWGGPVGEHVTIYFYWKLV